MNEGSQWLLPRSEFYLFHVSFLANPALIFSPPKFLSILVNAFFQSINEAVFWGGVCTELRVTLPAPALPVPVVLAVSRGLPLLPTLHFLFFSYSTSECCFCHLLSPVNSRLKIYGV